MGSPGKELVQETANPYITKEPGEANAQGSGLGLSPGSGLGPGLGERNDFKTPRKVLQFTYVPKKTEGEEGDSKETEEQEGEAMMNASVGFKGREGSTVPGGTGTMLISPSPHAALSTQHPSYTLTLPLSTLHLHYYRISPLNLLSLSPCTTLLYCTTLLSCARGGWRQWVYSRECER